MAAILDAWQGEEPGLDFSPVAVFGRISRIDRYLATALRALYRTHGIDAGEYDVLAALRRSGPGYRLTPTELYRSVLRREIEAAGLRPAGNPRWFYLTAPDRTDLPGHPLTRGRRLTAGPGTRASQVNKASEVNKACAEGG